MNDKTTSIQKNIQNMDQNNGDYIKKPISNKFAAQQCGTACGATTKHWFGSKNTGGAVN